MHTDNTRSLHDEQPTRHPSPRAARKRGRPPKPDALSDAERARRYRARKKARMAELQMAKQASDAIAPAVPAWKRCWATAMALFGRVRASLHSIRTAAWRL